MVVSMACGQLSSMFLNPSSFETRSYGLRVALWEANSASGSLIPQCKASGQSANNAPNRQIAAEDNPFGKPLSDIYSVLPCRFCQGLGEVKCDVCDGQGCLARGGFHKRNPVSITRIVGSNWTAMERTFGWHHFHVHLKRRGSGMDWFLEMVSACDDTTRFWVNARTLKDRERWSAGWLQRGELHGIKAEGEGEGEMEREAIICKACKGCRTQPCQMCAKSESSQSRELDIIEV